MRKDEFTPGPWEHKGTYAFSGSNCIVNCDTDNAPTARMIANAKLCAAAPDLLAALLECVEEVERYAEECGPCEHNVNICVCDLKRKAANARDAIAKATTP